MQITYLHISSAYDPDSAHTCNSDKALVGSDDANIDKAVHCCSQTYSAYTHAFDSCRRYEEANERDYVHDCVHDYAHDCVNDLFRSILEHFDSLESSCRIGNGCSCCFRGSYNYLHCFL